MAGLPGSYGAAGVLTQSRGEDGIADPDAEICLQRGKTEIEQNGIPICLSRGVVIAADLRQRGAPVHGAIILRQAKRDPLIPARFGDALRREGADGGMRFEGDAATRRHGRNGFGRLDEAHRLVMVARKFGDGAEGAEAPLRIGIGYFQLQEIDGRGAHRSHRNGKCFRHERVFSPGNAKGEYRLVRSGQAGPAGGRTGYCGQNVAPAFTM
jgi:hypothetical protein